MSIKVLNTPVRPEDITEIHVGDIIYLSGNIVTCRDVAHRRVVNEHMQLPVDIDGGAIIHAGPIVKPVGNDKFEMISIGPTTSMRMEKFEYEFIKKTGVRIIIGKGGMGEGTQEGCRIFKALHCVFPAGCAVVAATKIEKIEEVFWRDLGMPESLWVCRVREFGPLIVSIDAEGRNLFEELKIGYNRRKDKAYQEIARQVGFIK